MYPPWRRIFCDQLLAPHAAINAPAGRIGRQQTGHSPELTVFITV